MTKQEKIELILKKLYWQGRKNADIPITDISVRSEIEELMKLGVVLKVECPDCQWSQFKDEAVGMTPCYHCNSTGYIFEPLIEE